MLKDYLTLDSILMSFESVLKLEYDDKDTRKLLDSAIRKLENAYGVTLSDTLYTIQAQNMNVAENIESLIKQVMECTKTLSLYINVSLYNQSIGVNLATVNYLGFDKQVLKTALKYLQVSDLYEEGTKSIEAIMGALNNTGMCSVKRLFLIMLLLMRLGITESSAVVAQLLYLGGLIL